MNESIEQQQGAPQMQTFISSPAINVPSQPAPQTRKYFSRLFYGRMNRRNYVIGNLLLLIPAVAFLLLAPFLILLLPKVSLGSPVGLTIFIPLNLLAIAYCTFCIIYLVSFMLRRLHDLNRNGWFWLLSNIPFINLLLAIYLLFSPGSIGENKYGTQPLPRINITQDILRLS